MTPMGAKGRVRVKEKNSDQEDYTSDEESLYPDGSFDTDDPNAMPGWTICSDQIK